MSTRALRRERKAREALQDMQDFETVLGIEASGTAIEADFAIAYAVQFEAAEPAAGATLDPARNRTFRMEAYTGGLLTLPNYDAPLVVDLQGMAWPNSRLPIRTRHGKEITATIGQTSDLVNDKRQLVVAGFVAPITPEAQHIVSMNDRGFQWQASIEAKLRSRPEFIAAGQTVQVNGQTFTGPVYVARRTLLTGIGFVEIGADPRTSAAIAASLADPSANQPGAETPTSSGGSTMNFEQWCQSQGIDPSTLTPEQLGVAKAMFAGIQAGATCDPNAVRAALGVRANGAEPPPANPPANPPGNPPPDDMTAALDRLHQICGNHADIEAQAIEGNWDEGRTRRAVRVAELRASRPEGCLPPTSFGTVEGQLDPAVIEASLLIASGMSSDAVGHAFETLNEDMPTQRREQVINCALARTNRVDSFSGVFRRVLQARGIQAPDNKEELFNTAIYASQRGQLDIEAAGGNTMVNLPGIFGDAMNKRLLQAYEELPSVVPEFCQEVDAPDFKTLHSYRMNGIGGEMFELGTTGELKTVSFSEESYSNRLKTRGFMLTLPRELIINDDLRALEQITQLIGRNARRTRERIAFRTLLRAWATLFSATSSGSADAGTFRPINKLTGADSALAANGDAVRAAITLFTKMKDPNGDPIMIAPDRLLCGTTLGPLADDLYTKDAIVIAGSTNTVKFQENRVKGKLRPVVSPYMDPGNNILDSDDVTDLGSDTKWIAACDPRLMALVQIVYLSGKRSPTVETRADASFNTLGMSWRCFWDINAAAMELRAGVGSDGA